MNNFNIQKHINRKNFTKKIINSLPSLISSLRDENLNIFQQQENFEKVILGLEIIANQALANCDSIEKSLKKL